MDPSGWRSSPATKIEPPIETQAMIAEYTALREEINNNSSVIAQVFTISITGAVVILGFGIEQKLWTICLVPALLLLPSLLFISSQLESTVRIAAYIAVFIEPNPSVRKYMAWETALGHTRKGNGKSKGKGRDRSRLYYLRSVLGIYLMGLLACVIVGALVLGTVPGATSVPTFTSIDQFVTAPFVQYAASSIVILVLSMVTVMVAYQAFSDRRIRHYKDQWRETLAELRAESAKDGGDQ